MLKLFLVYILTVCSAIRISSRTVLAVNQTSNVTAVTPAVNATEAALHVNDSLLTKAKSFKPEDMPQVLKDNKFVLFTLSYCPWCKKAKKWLKKHGIKAYYVVVNKLDNSDEVITYINDYTGNDKYPKIFLNGEFLGGLKPLKDLGKDKEKWNAAMEKTSW